MSDSTPDEPSSLRDRVLFLPPTVKDGRITQTLLAHEGLACTICNTLPALISEMPKGGAALLLTEETITSDQIGLLLAELHEQPPWSDWPVVILMRGGGSAAAGTTPAATQALGAMTNVTLLERPAPMRSVASAVKAAVRGRRRQYEVRSLLEREQSARAELERAARMKDEFLATLSHELRTPLNAILGWSQLMSHARADPETITEGVAVIERNARVQVQLIEDLLDMSRIISGKVRLSVASVDLAGVVDAALDTILPTAEAKGVRLIRRVSQRSARILGDAARLQQVIWNLLSNAIKFTPRGGLVDVELRRAVDDPASLEICVTDTGAGIRRDFLPHVFERFRQADASTTRAYGGLGLGLAIVKHLVELHGGSAYVDSPGPGQGSTFCVRLPLASTRSETGDSLASPSSPAPHGGALHLHCDEHALDGVRVLVVDDEPDARNLVKRVLEGCRAEVITAGSARDALAMVAERRPDVLVSDIGMPDMDGYELLRRIRAWEKSTLDPEAERSILPAVALTAFARSEDHTRAIAAGYLAHLAKPIEPQQLIAAIATAAGRHRPAVQSG